jgi:hypothetical protein
MYTEIEINNIIDTFCSHITKSLDDVFYELVSKIEDRCRLHQEKESVEVTAGEKEVSPTAVLIKNELLELTKNKEYKAPNLPDYASLAVSSGVPEEWITRDFRGYYFRRFYLMNCVNTDLQPPESRRIPKGKYGISPQYFTRRCDERSYWSTNTFNYLRD